MLKFNLWLTEHACLGQPMLWCMSRIGSQNRNSLSMLPKKQNWWIIKAGTGSCKAVL